MEAASQDVKNAVDAVNLAVMQESKQQARRQDRQGARRPKDAEQAGVDMIEESLESLDFFKVTNLGRINRNE